MNPHNRPPTARPDAAGPSRTPGAGTALPAGVAHVSFAGGGVFLPADTPYERETLRDYVAHSVRAYGRVQVLLARRRWRIDGRRAVPAACAGCRATLEGPCPAAADGRGAAYCLPCAFDVDADMPDRAAG